jgi:hypothetical protein
MKAGAHITRLIHRGKVIWHSHACAFKVAVIILIVRISTKGKHAGGRRSCGELAVAKHL